MFESALNNSFNFSAIKTFCYNIQEYFHDVFKSLSLIVKFSLVLSKFFLFVTYFYCKWYRYNLSEVLGKNVHLNLIRINFGNMCKDVKVCKGDYVLGNSLGHALLVCSYAVIRMYIFAILLIINNGFLVPPQLFFDVN